MNEHITAQEMLQKFVETAMAHGNTGLTIVLAVCDEHGIASTIHRSDILEQAQPQHTENALLSLIGSFYNKYMVSAMNPKAIQFDEGNDDEGTLQ